MNGIDKSGLSGNSSANGADRGGLCLRANARGRRGIDRYTSMLTPLEPQVRFWDKRLEIRGFCPRNGTALLKGFKLGRRTLDTWHLGTDAKGFMSGLNTYYFI